MATVAKTGRSELIRQYVRNHPGCYAAQVADALGLSHPEISREMSRMAAAGTLIAEAGTKLNKYSMGRPPCKVRSGEEKRQEALAREAAKKALRAPQDGSPALRVPNAPRVRNPAPITQPARPGRPAQTVDEFLAQGGKIQILPVDWPSPVKYPRPGFGGSSKNKSGSGT